MGNIQSFYKFRLDKVSQGKYSFVPLEKVGNHFIFNKIFNSPNIEALEVAADIFTIPNEQFIITINLGNKVIPLCEFSRKKDLEEWSYLGPDSELIPKHGFEMLGFGKFYHEVDDALLYRLNPRNLEFEVFICEGKKSRINSLYTKFKNGDLNDEIETMIHFWFHECFAWDVLVCDFEEALEESVSNSDINQKPYKESL